MQIKSVLNQSFDGVMKETEKESKSVRFDLKLDNSNDGNGRFIPRSHIAQQLEEKFNSKCKSGRQEKFQFENE